ncbi:hypothetical protein DAEQUDRAFT_720313 [Daedalea quercina L-15889]|uniref:Arrestin C-terminal-like domain-containing protein n=1 Tax=Daedalea quercina L-15889 TaxID=1314783 RepID=A0A165ULM0_9APHY|nr:hypothetical protein DAEQUDRAFT_720313 [Daedalea quercina L-15889]
MGGPHASSSRPSISSHTSAASSHSKVAGLPGGFVRSDTLLSFGQSQTRNAAELQALMGNSSSRLKVGATVHVASRRRNAQGPGGTEEDAVALEQAKPRSRVEVDIVLESDTFIQGGFMKGHVKVKVRKQPKKEVPICVADPKVRVIGFECIPGESDRHTFYQCASPLSAITDSLDRLFDTLPDDDGFARAIEGVHSLPFAMRLPSDSKFGAAKGVLNLHSGVIVQYIAMVSIKVKDPKTGRRSIAHFFRNCEVWPRLNASILLASAPRPLQATVSKSLAMLNSERKVKLTAQLHRLTWVAGQRCHVNVAVVNETKKTVKSFTLALIRSTTTFKPTPELDAGRARSVDPDACQTTTLHKVVAETALEMAQPGTKGRASAKGWWTGVDPGKELSFSHYILIPPEALSVTRSRLLEVEYSIRITLSAGSLTPDVHVTLPIRVINFLSIDPIPSEPFHSLLVESVHPLKRRRSIDGELDSLTGASFRSLAPTDEQPDVDSCGSSLLQQERRRNSARAMHEAQHSLCIINPDQAPSSIAASESSDSDASAYSSDTSYHPGLELVSSSDGRISRRLGNLDLEDPNSDEEVEFVVGSAGVHEPDDSIIAGPEYGTSRASVPRPLGPRDDSRCDGDRGRTREVRPIQRRNTINMGTLPRREYRNVRDETERMARKSFVAGVNERLLEAAAQEGTFRHGSYPGELVYSSHSATNDTDATPRLAQDQSDVPRVPIRPLRPSRNPARRTPAPSGNGAFPTGGSESTSVVIGTTADATSAPDSAFSQPSVRRSRALPRPPVNMPAANADRAVVPAPTALVVGQTIYDGLPNQDRFPGGRSEDTILVSAGDYYVPITAQDTPGCYPPDPQATVRIDVPRETVGASLRGRTMAAHAHRLGSAARSESSSSTSTTSGSGYESGQSSDTSMTSLQASDGGRPTAGMRMAGASESAVQGRIAEFEDRVKYAFV